MPYSLAIRCLSEFLSTAVFICLGNGVVANELLAATKGQSMGFGFVSIGFGMAVGFAATMFGHISSSMNPALIVAAWVKGSLPFSEIWPLMFSAIAGAFFGQVLVFLLYLPHYNVVPQLEDFETITESVNVLKEHQSDGESALRLSSHKHSMASLKNNDKSTKENEIYLAAVEADQAKKLSTCSTRPAIDAPVYNFICEFIGTFILSFGGSLIDDRLTIDPDTLTTSIYSRGLSPLITSFFIMTLVMVLGGPTGFSANPARDLGPRIAHALLPINGKGPSEWRYSLISNSAVFCGAIVGALAYKLFRSTVY
ncbi:aquaporin-like protein [Globomyces pollinis-pini]|nr:aquaporin-like protein [Globomyces pollinis-pini]